MKKFILKSLSNILLCCSLCLAVGIQAQAAEASVTESDVTATISVEKDEYSFGEEVNYTLTIENNREGWTSSQTKFKYSNEGLKSYDGEDLDCTIDRLTTGESCTLTGTLIGEDVEVGSSHAASTSNTGIVLPIVIGLIVLALVFVLITVFKRKKPRSFYQFF